MQLTPTALPGVFVVEPTLVPDERGFFARTYESALLPESQVVYRAIAQNAQKGTLRGLHYQQAPHGEPKWVHCIRGSIWDVVVDLRPGPTFLQYIALTLNATTLQGLYLPPGVAHGYQTLEADSWVEYLIGAAYVPAAATGLRWDDPQFNIPWPLPVSCISSKDACLPIWDNIAHLPKLR